ncbi:ribosomal protein L7/L12 [Streptomyces sp. CG1]|uniref:ribosomal protein L7/L12 n=1 Tax=Streptomyces sp. CG1 TaxID=1287523 RepID=UPI0034E1B4D3
MDIAGFFLFLALLAGVFTIESRISRADRRVARVEHKLDLILDHLGLREDDPRMDEVIALARDGKKVQAIKVYREMTDAGLKEAKEAVERLV